MVTSNQQALAPGDEHQDTGQSEALRFIERLLPLFIFLAAFVPRLAAIGKYVTPDEPIWVYRSLEFRNALLSADWASTIQSGHPGVTTTWLGAIGAQIQLWIQPQSHTHLEWIEQLYWLTPENGAAMQHLSSFLTASRISVIFVTSLGVAAIYWLACSRLGRTPALAAALLLALDPFSAGLGGLLHVDALLSVFMVITVLLLLPRHVSASANAQDQPITPDNKRLVLAGVFTGLAILTKIPGLFLVLMVPIIWLWPSSNNGPYRSRLLKLGFWALALLLTILILLPAAWSSPKNVWELTSDLSGRLISSGIRPSFFLGEMVLEPGPTFYPLAVIFRLSPAVTIGLLALIFMSVFDIMRKRDLNLPPNILWLLVYSLGYIVFLYLSAKRIDRYALPALTSLTIVAGWSLVAFYHIYIDAYKIRWVVASLMGILLISFYLANWPFPLTAFNWITGGPLVAQHVLPSGWGEGASDGAAWAAELEGARDRKLYSNNLPAASAFFPGEVLQMDRENLARIESKDLILFDNHDWQSNRDIFDNLAASGDLVLKHLSSVTPVYQSSFAVLPRAALYSGITAEELSLDPVSTSPLLSMFGDQVIIDSAGALPASWPEPIRAAITWQINQPADFQLQLRLVDESGHSWISQETPLLNQEDQLSRFWPAGQTQTVYYSLPLPADIPPGSYQLTARLFDQEGANLGVFDLNGQFRGVVAPLTSLDLESPTGQPTLKIPISLDHDWSVVGHGPIPETIESGQRLALDLWWRHSAEAPASANLLLMLGSATLVSEIQTGGMRPGLTYHIRASWQTPADLPTGSHPLSLILLDANGDTIWTDAVSIGEISVVSTDRLYTLPDDLKPLEVRLGSVAYLQDADIDLSGDEVTVSTIWQAIDPDDTSYSVFLHLLDSAGNIVDQDDRLPLIPSNQWLAEQVVIDQKKLTAPREGRFQIALGLYDPNTGIRLPMLAADGTLFPENQYLFEITVP